ncbi:Wzz/FepE/Etk N-terminal domain-containing protein, partial [bacterium]|nr:Wzz/FepE/Etk N-terminal domain-containing protein [bacterium]
MSQSGKTVHLKDYIFIIKKRAVFILFTVLLTFSLTFLLNHLLSPIYSAEVRLLIEEKLQDVNITRNSLLPFQEEFFETQREIFESVPVFEV